MKLISVVTYCYNEQENVEPLCEEIRSIFKKYSNKYDYEHIFIDNNSSDGTVQTLRKIAARDTRVKLIVCARNFGSVRSSYYALFQAKGDAVVHMAADFQEPPELIHNFIEEWEKGAKVVVGVKQKSDENWLMFSIRKFYYKILERISEVQEIKGFTGYFLGDRSFIDCLKSLDDPFPYLRGLIPELGFERAEIEFTQPVRKHGKSKNNFYSLYEFAMLGFVSHSKFPLRLATFLGFVISFLSFLVASIYLIYKLLYWEEFQTGTAPLIIGLFFFSSIQLIFIGIVGEYIGVIYTQVLKRPLVIERERVNLPPNINQNSD